MGKHWINLFEAATTAHQTSTTLARCTLPTLAVVQAVGGGRRGEGSAHFEVDRRAIFQAVAVGDWRARQGVADDVAKAAKR